MAEIVRCRWAGTDPLMMRYHDEEWGVPEHDSRALWEKLILDGFQAGLSWLTVLRKRDAFREAFAGFHPETVTAFRPADVEKLLQNPGIIRSRAKIEAAIGNARVYIEMKESGEDFSSYVWGLAGGKPIRNAWSDHSQIPAKTELSLKMSNALRKRGYKFVGPVIVYAWMQATGIVNDHEQKCFRHGVKA